MHKLAQICVKLSQRVRPQERPAHAKPPSKHASPMSGKMRSRAEVLAGSRSKRASTHSPGRLLQNSQMHCRCSHVMSAAQGQLRLTLLELPGTPVRGSARQAPVRNRGSGNVPICANNTTKANHKDNGI